MDIEISRISKVFGDRILVRRLGRPDKMRGILVPKSYIQDKTKEQHIWYGIVEKFGLDSRYGEAYDIKEGDIVGINDIGISNASFQGDDEQEHFWVMEEFIAFKDNGRVQAFQEDRRWEYAGVGIIPVGAYSVVLPKPAEEKRGGVYIPHGSAFESLTGEVLEVSKGEVVDSELQPIRVTKGSEVLFGKYSGLKAKLDQEFLLVKEEDLIAELEHKKTVEEAFGPMDVSAAFGEAVPA